MPYKLAYFVSHPIQYQAPLLALLSEHPLIDLSVFFLSGKSTKAHHDIGFNQKVEWDVPLTSGYTHTFLDSTETNGHYSLNNPKVSLASVKAALHSDKWDAVWVHGYNNLAFLYVIWFSYRTKTPLFFRGESNLTCSPKGFLKDQFVRRLVRHAHALLWVSSDNRDYYKYYGARDQQLFFTPYAVNNIFFQNTSAQTQTSERSGDIVFLYASKFIERKHAPLLLNAFIAIPPKLRERAKLWFVGDGEDKPVLEALLNEHNLQNQVKLLGFKNQTELPGIMARCQVFVLPSEREPFGLVINEAMNLAKAIITTNQVGAARDLVTPSKNGWIVKAGDIESLKSAMLDAIEKASQLDEMGQNSLTRINQWGYQQDVEGIISALKSTENVEHKPVAR